MACIFAIPPLSIYKWDISGRVPVAPVPPTISRNPTAPSTWPPPLP